MPPHERGASPLASGELHLLSPGNWFNAQPIASLEITGALFSKAQTGYAEPVVACLQAYGTILLFPASLRSQ